MARTAGSTHRQASKFAAEFGNLLHDLLRAFDPYRPELHYMRGPGPKWHAKHDGGNGDFPAVPAFVRVRVKR